MKTYREKLLDPRWQRRRLEILQRDEWRCRVCFREDRTLHVHHRWYLGGLDPWEYDDDQLLTLCEDCHERETGLVASLRKAMSRMPVWSADVVEGFIRAMAGDAWPDDPNVGISVGATCFFETYEYDWRKMRGEGRRPPRAD